MLGGRSGGTVESTRRKRGGRGRRGNGDYLGTEKRD